LLRLSQVQVLQHREVAEDPGDLEGAPEAERGPPVRPQRGDVLPEQGHAAGGRPQLARQQVEQGGLARPVRPDDAEAGPLGDAQRDVRHGRDAAEAAPQVIGG